MFPLNPLADPRVEYLRLMLAVRVDRLRSEEDRSVGASAIEWAIITALLAAIAAAIGLIIKKQIHQAADNIKVNTPQG
ncbi:hypothetical protein [Actinomadura harenae]|uniref:Uncharacterized protein n=1 Tax=Actinomadura harenae TaxID=2483351 RepID=A0A3M2LHK4_9ACTN|nr:hypothetical protein [Actinomadura harenae]RMI36962.1 hypothetical protein EBO15_37200 [Actinomadura harenae]